MPRRQRRVGVAGVGDTASTAESVARDETGAVTEESGGDGGDRGKAVVAERRRRSVRRPGQGQERGAGSVARQGRGAGRGGGKGGGRLCGTAEAGGGGVVTYPGLM